MDVRWTLKRRCVPAGSLINAVTVFISIRAIKIIIKIVLFFSSIAVNLWSVTKNACKQNNDRTYDNIQTLKECQEICERESWCRSMDYNTAENKCLLSKLNSSSSFYYSPCYITPDNYIYAEIGRGKFYTFLYMQSYRKVVILRIKNAHYNTRFSYHQIHVKSHEKISSKALIG